MNTATQSIDTEAAASERIAPKVPSLKDRVLAALQAAGDEGLTPTELAATLDEHFPSVRPRITDLRKDGKVKDSGRVRNNERGNPEKVFVLGYENFVGKSSGITVDRLAQILKTFGITPNDVITKVLWCEEPEGNSFWNNLWNNLYYKM